MAERLLHPAPPDYGIVEIRESGATPRFVVYHSGSEIARCGSLEQARALTESGRHQIGQTRTPGPINEPQPIPTGCP